MGKSQIGIRQFVDKVMDDAEFFKALQVDPAAALSDAGIDATPQQIDALKKINYESLRAVAKAFGPGREIVT